MWLKDGCRLRERSVCGMCEVGARMMMIEGGSEMGGGGEGSDKGREREELRRGNMFSGCDRKI